MEAKSFREQLMAIRPTVEAAAEDREQREREKRERTKDKLVEELKQNPPEQFLQQIRDLEDAYKVTNKRFCPGPAIQDCVQELDRLEEKVKRYTYYLDRFPDIYSESMKRSLKQIPPASAAVRKKIGPQWEQWQSIEELLAKTEFRARKKGDETALVDTAKEFHKRAHGMQLDVPKSLFAAKRDNFFVVAAESTLMGYFESFPDEKRVTFALVPPAGVNFIKFVRGTVHKFCTAGPTELPRDLVNLRLYGREEVKFYTDLGFMRTETLGMSDWLYQRKF